MNFINFTFILTFWYHVQINLISYSLFTLNCFNRQNNNLLKTQNLYIVKLSACLRCEIQLLQKTQQVFTSLLT